jgi:GNAT superfamily N-acetyltransferase
MNSASNPIRIIRWEDSRFSISDIIHLLHSAFKEREEQGLNMGGINISVEELEIILQDAVMYVAEREDHLIGVLTARYAERETRTKPELYCHLGYVAVSPAEKRSGIGGMLLNCLEEEAKKKGCRYIISNTAESAESAVAWHLKQGFRKIKYTHWKSRNYPSIIFRKELSFSLRRVFPFISDILYKRSKRHYSH